jgi:hypothetical protein
VTPAERRARVRGAALEGGDRTASRDRRRLPRARYSQVTLKFVSEHVA